MVEVDEVRDMLSLSMTGAVNAELRFMLLVLPDIIMLLEVAGLVRVAPRDRPSRKLGVVELRTRTAALVVDLDRPCSVGEGGEVDRVWCAV